MSQGSSSRGTSRGPLLASGKLGALTRYPLVACPDCGGEVIELVSGTVKNPGKIFFMCCENE
uniref:Uncharacterized protein n=1 Tax=Arundo donax TaxID=35708 RepID=A0A0A9DVS4_ARUDO